MVALIHGRRHFQAVFLPHLAHELPESCRPGYRNGRLAEVALDGHQVFQVVRHPVLGQQRFNLRENPRGALEHQQRIGMAVGEGDQFAVHPLAQIDPVETDGIAGENHHVGHLRDPGGFADDGPLDNDDGISGGYVHRHRPGLRHADGRTGLPKQIAHRREKQQEEKKGNSTFHYLLS